MCRHGASLEVGMKINELMQFSFYASELIVACGMWEINLKLCQNCNVLSKACRFLRRINSGPNSGMPNAHGTVSQLITSQ
jgi:hypothetical protein